MFIVYQRRLHKSFLHYTMHNQVSNVFIVRHVFDLNEHMQSLKFPIEVTLNDV